MNALILVDLQNDFTPSGALPVPEGDSIVPLINQLQQKFDLVVATKTGIPLTMKVLQFSTREDNQEN